MVNRKGKNAPAHPVNIREKEQLVIAYPGLTKREYAVIQILSGLIANDTRNKSYKDCVDDAVAYTDTLFEALYGKDVK